MVTHDLDVASAVADDAVLMHDGYTVESGPPRTLWQQGRHPATRAFAAAWPRLPDAWPPPPSTTAEPVLTVQDLTVRYGNTTAVQNVSLTIHAGERVAIVGRSGSGKSTLISRLAGAPRRDVQWVMQDAGRTLDPRLTVSRSIVEALHAHAVRDADGGRARVERVLAEVGLSAGFTERFPHELSTGQQQRVAIARALILDPRRLVLDEPVSALDPVSAARIVDVLARISAARALTLVFVTHDLARVPQIADRVVVMHEGRVIDDGPTAEILTRPSHAVTQALIDAQRAASA
jgi:peptide/nickel transport system ATP-binding protein